MLQDGALAEWLRSGLQNRVHRFNSGRHLHFLSKNSRFYSAVFVYKWIIGSLLLLNFSAFLINAATFS